ncbi:hypothetical protein [Bradyrhizobium sp. 930_D9_N1_4]|uniref:hypothetical protein n=1 Tax=Bradyrhizobium sp. 930_D9_N1_4 TaxID=3240374 RepID=UPI003F8C5C2F
MASWIKVHKDDERTIFTAASHAQRASDFSHGSEFLLPHNPTPRSWPAPTRIASTILLSQEQQSRRHRHVGGSFARMVSI